MRTETLRLTLYLCHTGVCVSVSGAFVMWRSMMQTLHTASTTEAVHGSRVVLHARLTSLKITVWCDNKAAVVIGNGEERWRTRSLLNRVMYVESHVAANVISLRFVPSTAPMTTAAREHHGSGLMLKCCHSWLRGFPEPLCHGCANSLLGPVCCSGGASFIFDESCCITTGGS